MLSLLNQGVFPQWFLCISTWIFLHFHLDFFVFPPGFVFGLWFGRVLSLLNKGSLFSLSFHSYLLIFILWFLCISNWISLYFHLDLSLAFGLVSSVECSHFLIKVYLHSVFFVFSLGFFLYFHLNSYLAFGLVECSFFSIKVHHFICLFTVISSSFYSNFFVFPPGFVFGLWFGRVLSLLNKGSLFSLSFHSDLLIFILWFLCISTWISLYFLLDLSLAFGLVECSHF